MIPESVKIAQKKPTFKVNKQHNAYHPYKLLPINSAINLYKSNSSVSNIACNSSAPPFVDFSVVNSSALSTVDSSALPTVDSSVLLTVESSALPTVEPSPPKSSSASSSNVITKPGLMSDTEDITDIENISDIENIDDKKLWPNSIIKSLLAYLSDHMKDYQFRKNQFYVKAALYLSKGKIGSQVATKIRWLINKYMKESANKMGKGASKWEFFTEMNEIFGNRENVHPDYLIDSTGK
ncbi:231_t:CDS:1, partial [Racocetra fulgida]